MARLNDGILQFFRNQGCVIVSTVDKNGLPHCACKGIVKINKNGRVYLLDLYHAQTRDNLKHNARISITAVDEHKFIGYCLKGKAEITPSESIAPAVIRTWEARIAGRLTQRLLKNIHEEKGHPRHPEILLPEPKYMIVMEVKKIVDLTPQHLKKGV